jgi:phosphoenolpyruvate carboxylase
LRERLQIAVNAILRITGQSRLLASNPVLRRSIDVRNPYVDPINLVQVELLRRMRTTDTQNLEIARAFMITVNGIAAGMRNIG